MSADKPDVLSSPQGRKDKAVDTEKLEEQPSPFAHQPGPSSPAPKVVSQVSIGKRRLDEPQQPLSQNVQAPTPEGQQLAASNATEKLAQGEAAPPEDVGLDVSTKKRRPSPTEPETQPGTSKAVDPQLLTEAEIFAEPYNALLRLRVKILPVKIVLPPRLLEIERFGEEQEAEAVVPISGTIKVVDTPDDARSDILRFKDDIGPGYLRVIGKIGVGGFGQVYAAWDCHKKNLVAIKAETEISDAVIEREVLLKFKDNIHCPEFRDVFKIKLQSDQRIFCIVMQLLNSNLDQIRCKCKLGGPNYRLNMATAYGVTVQCLDALKGLHGIEYVHRDIKPENFAAGVGNSKLVYLYDFGLSRRFSRLRRRGLGRYAFRGTLRYASINAHNELELGPRDDLISLYYSFIELICGRLPWANLNNMIQVKKSKERFNLVELCKGMPAEVQQIAHTIEHLEFTAEPNYDKMCGLLRVCMTTASNGIADEYDIDYEWLHDDCTTFDHFTAAPEEMPQKTPEQEAGPASDE